MSVNPSATWKDVVRFLDASIAAPVIRGSVPTAVTLRRVDGQITPYCVVRFSTPGRAYGGNGFGGARHDSFFSFCDVMCVAQNDDIAGDLSGLVLDTLIGYRPVNASQMTPRAAPGQFSVLDSADKPQAEISIASFQFNYNFSDVAN